MDGRRYFNRTIRWSVIALAATAAVLVGALVAQGGQPDLATTESVAPNPVESGQDTLYTVSYENNSGATLSNSSIVITLPAGTAFKAAAPDVCTAAAPAANGTIAVKCPRGLMPAGTLFAQQVVFSAPIVPTGTKEITVTSLLKFNERDNDGDTGPKHDDQWAAKDVTTVVHADSDDLVGKCASKNGETMSTQGGSTSRGNPQITGAVVPANEEGQLCSPVVLREVPAESSEAAGACPTGATCTTQVSITASPEFATNPVQLSFKLDSSFFGRAPDPATFKWYKNGVLVPNCTTPGELGPDPCITTRARHGQKGIELGVLWSGNDPSWVGGAG